MNNDPKQKEPTGTAQPKPNADAPRNDKPPLLEPGPIIIKGSANGGELAAAGRLVDFESQLFDFEEDAGMPGRHYVSRDPLRITSMRYRDGDANSVGVDFTSSDVRIFINIEP